MDQNDRATYVRQIEELEKLLNDQKAKLTAINNEKANLSTLVQTETQKAQQAHQQRMAQLTQAHQAEMSKINQRIQEKEQAFQAQQRNNQEEERKLKDIIQREKASFNEKLASEQGMKRQMEMNYQEIVESQEFFKFQVDPTGLAQYCEEKKTQDSVFLQRVKKQLEQLLGGSLNPAFLQNLNSKLRKSHPEIRKSWASMIAEIHSKNLSWTAAQQKGITISQLVEGLLIALKKDRRYSMKVPSRQGQAEGLAKCQDYIVVDMIPNVNLVYKLANCGHVTKPVDEQELETVIQIVVC